MSSSLLFDYVATYMYEDDTPPAERRAQALSLDRDLLRELLGSEELRDLLDADAVEEVERQLRGDAADARRAARPAAHARRPPAGEYDPVLAEPLLAERRAVLVRIAGEERLIAAEDAGRYRDALGVMPPGGLPDVFLEGGPDSLRQLVLRFAQGPRAVHDGRGRASGSAATSSAMLAELEREELLVRGELRPGGTEREWCDPDVLRRLRRASLAALRREVEPVEPAALARFLPSWHGIDRRASLREALVPLQALALPVGLWESELLPRRVPGYRPEQLDSLCASGEVVWVGAGLDRVAVYFREDAAALGRGAGAPRRRSARRTTRSARALDRARCSGTTCSTRPGSSADEALPALWDLVWAGEVTNDAWTPLRAGRRNGVPRPERRPRRFSRSRAAGPTATQGRWSRTERLFAGTPERRALAELLLERHGDRHPRRRAGRGHPGRLRRRLRGAARARDARALPARLLRRGPRRRAVRPRRRGRAAARAARRPTRSRAGRARRPPTRRSRTARRSVAEASGRARRAGRAARTWCWSAARRCLRRARRPLARAAPRPRRGVAAARARRARRLRPRRAAPKRLAVERFDGEPVTESEVMPLLVEAGFLAGPRRAVLRP